MWTVSAGKERKWLGGGQEKATGGRGKGIRAEKEDKCESIDELQRDDENVLEGGENKRTNGGNSEENKDEVVTGQTVKKALEYVGGLW